MLITKEDLDTRICDIEPDSQNTQTYREYIKESEEEFGLIPKELDGMNDRFLNDYMGFLDYLWEK